MLVYENCPWKFRSDCLRLDQFIVSLFGARWVKKCAKNGGQNELKGSWSAPPTDIIIFNELLIKHPKTRGNNPNAGFYNV